jgi:hypothetical protein
MMPLPEHVLESFATSIVQMQEKHESKTPNSYGNAGFFEKDPA